MPKKDTKYIPVDEIEKKNLLKQNGYDFSDKEAFNIMYANKKEEWKKEIKYLIPEIQKIISPEQSPIIEPPIVTQEIIVPERKDLSYYSNPENLDEMNLYLSTKYDQLANEARSNPVYNQWIRDFDRNSSFEDVAESISNLPISEDMQLFLLSNAADKLEQSEISSSDMEIIYNPIFTPSTPQERQFENEIVSNAVPSNQELTNEYENKFTFLGATVQAATAWDVNEEKGDIDPISGMYYSKLLATLPNRGWNNGDADDDFTAHKVKFTWRKDLGTSSKTDSFYLLYNSARDREFNNEDYTFCGIVPLDSRHITTLPDGTKLPSIFTGTPDEVVLRFDQGVQLHNSGAHIDNPYIISSHDEDKGDDNNGGNYLEGVSPAPALNGLNGSSTMNDIAKDMVDMVNNTLRAYYDLNFLNPNYLIEQIVVEENGEPVSKNVYKFDASGNKIPVKGISGISKHYNALTEDETIYSVSNQDILNNSTTSLISELNNNLSMVQSGASTATFILGVLSSYKHEYSLGISMLHSFATGWFASVVLEIATADWNDEDAWFDVLSRTVLDLAIFTSVSFITTLHELVGVFCGATIIFIQAILSFYKVGNGFSVMQNWGDHGLNDWRFQLKNNASNIALIEKHFSNGYTSGIDWKVTDGWFSLPNLYIRTQANNSWLNLSPENEFNYGNKIEMDGVTNV